LVAKGFEVFEEFLEEHKLGEVANTKDFGNIDKKPVESIMVKEEEPLTPLSIPLFNILVFS